MKAFQAYIRHGCRLIFRPREPDFAGLAGSFALLSMTTTRRNFLIDIRLLKRLKRAKVIGDEFERGC